jgi:hypothetical protein
MGPLPVIAAQKCMGPPSHKARWEEGALASLAPCWSHGVCHLSLSACSPPSIPQKGTQCPSGRQSPNFSVTFQRSKGPILLLWGLSFNMNFVEDKGTHSGVLQDVHGVGRLNNTPRVTRIQNRASPSVRQRGALACSQTRVSAFFPPVLSGFELRTSHLLGNALPLEP